jgi:flagellar protein FliO/FliZ
MTCPASSDYFCTAVDRGAVGARHAGEFADLRRTRSHGELLQRFYRNLCRASLALLSLAAGPQLAVAQEAAPPSLQAPIGSGDILSVGASLIVVVAAIMLCGWLYSRSQGLRVRGGGGIISIIATQPLGPKERILLIEVADKQLIVGMTSTQVSTLHVFDEPVVRQEAGMEQRANFSDRLKNMLRGSGT